MRFLVDECTGPAVAHWLRGQNHGVVLLRLEDERANSKTDAIRRLLRDYAERLPTRFVVVTETRVRFARSG